MASIKSPHTTVRARHVARAVLIIRNLEQYDEILRGELLCITGTSCMYQVFSLSNPFGEQILALPLHAPASRHAHAILCQTLRYCRGMAVKSAERLLQTGRVTWME